MKIKDRIRLVKSQVKKAISDQKWSVVVDKRRHGGDWTTASCFRTLTYLNSINEGVNMNDATIKITVISKFKYDDDSSSRRKVSISIKNGGYWQDFNGLSYGFSKFELRILRWILKYKAIEKDKLHKEYLKQKAIKNLAIASGLYIDENKSQFRDSKLEQILEK